MSNLENGKKEGPNEVLYDSTTSFDSSDLSDNEDSTEDIETEEDESDLHSGHSDSDASEVEMVDLDFVALGIVNFHPTAPSKPSNVGEVKSDIQQDFIEKLFHAGIERPEKNLPALPTTEEDNTLREEGEGEESVQGNDGVSADGADNGSAERVECERNADVGGDNVEAPDSHGGGSDENNNSRETQRKKGCLRISLLWNGCCAVMLLALLGGLIIWFIFAQLTHKCAESCLRTIPYDRHPEDPPCYYRGVYYNGWSLLIPGWLVKRSGVGYREGVKLMTNGSSISINSANSEDDEKSRRQTYLYCENSNWNVEHYCDSKCHWVLHCSEKNGRWNFVLRFSASFAPLVICLIMGLLLFPPILAITCCMTICAPWPIFTIFMECAWEFVGCAWEFVGCVWKDCRDYCLKDCVPYCDCALSLWKKEKGCDCGKSSCDCGCCSSLLLSTFSGEENKRHVSLFFNFVLGFVNIVMILINYLFLCLMNIQINDRGATRFLNEVNPKPKRCSTLPVSCRIM